MNEGHEAGSDAIKAKKNKKAEGRFQNIKHTHSVKQ